MEGIRITERVEADSHADAREQMQVMMHEMRNVIYERHISALEQDDRRRRYALRLANTIDTSAGEIENFAVMQSQNDGRYGKDIAVFHRYANTLRTESDSIRKLAAAYRMEELESAIGSVIVTCTACHDRLGVGPVDIR